MRLSLALVIFAYALVSVSTADAQRPQWPERPADSRVPPATPGESPTSDVTTEGNDSAGNVPPDDPNTEPEASAESKPRYVYGITAHATRHDSTGFAAAAHFLHEQWPWYFAPEFRVMHRGQFLDLELRMHAIISPWGGLLHCEFGPRFRAVADPVGFAFRVNAFVFMWAEVVPGVIFGPQFSLKIDDVHLSLGVDFQIRFLYDSWDQITSDSSLEVKRYNKLIVRPALTIEFPFHRPNTIFIQFEPLLYKESGKIKSRFIWSLGAWFR